MVQEKTMYGVMCDNCKDTLETYDGIAFWHNQDDAEENAMNKDWLDSEGKHYCPDCFSHNNEDELVINATRFKPHPINQ